METGGAEAAGGAVFLVLILFVLAVNIFMIVAMWKVLEKAGQPGWAILVPIYNLVVMLRVAGHPGWWIILLLIPIVNLIPAILIPIGIARNFGKGSGFGLGLLFLGIIFYPVLAFGDARYVG